MSCVSPVRIAPGPGGTRSSAGTPRAARCIELASARDRRCAATTWRRTPSSSRGRRRGSRRAPAPRATRSRRPSPPSRATRPGARCRARGSGLPSSQPRCSASVAVMSRETLTTSSTGRRGRHGVRPHVEPTLLAGLAIAAEDDPLDPSPRARGGRAGRRDRAALRPRRGARTARATPARRSEELLGRALPNCRAEASFA